MLVMALILLSLRVAIERIFRNHFPTWFAFESYVQANFWSGNRTETKETNVASSSESKESKSKVERRLDKAKMRSREEKETFIGSEVLNVLGSFTPKFEERC